MMGCGKSKIIFLSHLVSFGIFFSGCFGSSSQPSEQPAQGQCAPSSLSQTRGSPLGEAHIFWGDPISASGNPDLAPTSPLLDQFRTSVGLQNLSGEGVLKGSLVEVRNNLQCDGDFGAYQPDQKFNYSHSDFRFQEAMSYYYADAYQSHLKQSGYLLTQSPIRVYAHCEWEDNAYFTWARDTQSGQIFQMICLGDSVETPGAYYSDDSQVIIHELQHASTSDQYSSEVDLNQFFYDEAGSMNEAISDFMALAYADAFLKSSLDLDPRIFSRWALGTFFQGSDGSRGAHQCPVYDPHFPQCDEFPSTSTSSLSSSWTLSFSYPDGLGWPYRLDSISAPSLADVLRRSTSQEEIHHAGVIVTGALWDIYTALKQNHAGDAKISFRMISQLVLESLRHLPQPDESVNHSPVTFIEMAKQLVTYAPYITGFSSLDQTALAQVLTARGLYRAPQIEDVNWLSVGSGTNFRLKTSQTPGLKVSDDPIVLKRWLIQQGSDSSVVRQDLSQALNSELDPGEVAMIWFDLKNNSQRTAGGVLLTVSSLDPEVEVLDSRFNIGYLSASSSHQTQVMYGKVNGADILSALHASGIDGALPMGNTYFSTNPYFYQNYRTGIWIRALRTAPHGKWVRFQVTAQPANGVASTQEFTMQIH